MFNISETSEYELSSEDKVAWLKKIEEEPDSRSLRENELISIRKFKAIAIYVACLKQCTSRHEWTNAYDMKIKDTLRSQCIKIDPRFTDLLSLSP